MNYGKKQIVNLIIKIIILVFLFFGCNYAIGGFSSLYLY